MAKSKSHSTRRAKVVAQKRRQTKRQAQVKKVPGTALLELLPRQLVEEIGQETSVDVQVKHLYGSLMLLLLIYAILEEKDESLRQLEGVYNSQAFKVFSGKGGHTTRHSSIASRLEAINADFFERLYEGFLDNVRAKHGKKLERDFGWLARFDSTMVALSAALSEIGMRVGAKPKHGEGKVQVKFTVGLAGLLPVFAKVSHDQKHLSEETALYEAIQAYKVKGSKAVVFDMGLKGRKRLAGLSEQGIFFATRLKNPRYEVVRTHREVAGRQAGKLRLESDLIVRLYASGAQEALPTEFRLITAKCERGKHAGKTLYFLTNILDLGAAQVAEVYRRRWDIEVFFRFLKQEVGLKNLLCYHENGIKSVFYVRLLTATMLKLYMWLNKREDYKISKLAFAEEIRWEITLLIARMAGGDTRNIVNKLSDFEGLYPAFKT